MYIEKTKIKKKRPGMAHFEKTMRAGKLRERGPVCGELSSS